MLAALIALLLFLFLPLVSLILSIVSVGWFFAELVLLLLLMALLTLLPLLALLVSLALLVLLTLLFLLALLVLLALLLSLALVVLLALLFLLVLLALLFLLALLVLLALLLSLALLVLLTLLLLLHSRLSVFWDFIISGRVAVPTVSPLFPFTTPVIAPAWRRVDDPASEIRGGLAVVAHGNAKHKRWHVIAIDPVPRPVVPAA